MTSLADKLLSRLLASENLLANALDYDLNMAPILRVFGGQVGHGAVFHGLFASSATFIGPDASIGRGAKLGRGVRVGAGSTIRRDAVLGSGVQIGDRCIVGEGARVENLCLGSASMIETEVLCLGLGEGSIRIGVQSYIGVRNVLDWSDQLVIGDYVHIAGPSTGVWTHTSVAQALHGDPLEDKTRRVTRPVHIGDRVYIGGNCTIYPGVTIGSGSIVLPNSAVSADVEAGVLAGGVPARIVRRLET